MEGDMNYDFVLNENFSMMEADPNCSRCNEFNNSMVGAVCVYTHAPRTPADSLNPWKEVPELRINVGVYVPCIMGGLIGNIAVLAVMLSDKKSRNRETWRTNMFLVSLAISDLLLVMVAAPTELLQYFYFSSAMSGTSCKVSEYFRVLSAAASILNLTAVTLERFIVIVYPMRSRSLCTTSNCRKALLIVWISALALSVPVILNKNMYQIFYANCTDIASVYYCNDFDDNFAMYYHIYQLLVIFTFPCFLMIICYSVVIKTLWQAANNMARMTQISTNGKNYSSVKQTGAKKVSIAPTVKDMRGERKQVIKMLILVVILFVLCWGPRFLLETLLKMSGAIPEEIKYSPVFYWIRVIFYSLPFIHAIINPLIYFAMSKHFREEFFKRIDSCFSSSSSHRELEPKLSNFTNYSMVSLRVTSRDNRIQVSPVRDLNEGERNRSLDGLIEHEEEGIKRKVSADCHM